MFHGKVSLPLPYLSLVHQIFIRGGGIFRELELLGSYLKDPYLRGTLWLREPLSFQRDALFSVHILALPVAPTPSGVHLHIWSQQEHIWQEMTP